MASTIFNLLPDDYNAFKSADAKLVDRRASNRTIFFTRISDSNPPAVSAVYGGYVGQSFQIRTVFNSPILTEALLLADFPDSILVANVVGV